jgi:hypothetical protein
MGYTLREFRAMPEDELTALYDRWGTSNDLSPSLVLDELTRRALDQAASASHRLAVWNTVLAGVAAAVAVLALFF